MPNPKRRHSKSRRGKRRAHDHLQAPLLVSCPHCKAQKQAHSMCPNCGYYGERQVIELEEA